MTTARWTLPLVYDEALVRRAARVRFRRQHGPAFWLLLAAALVCGAAAAASGAPGWVLSGLATGLACAVALTVAAYAVPLRHGLRAVRTMGDGRATLRIGDGGFEVESEAGRVELPWRAVTRLWKAPDVWVLVYTPATSSLLPAGALPPDARAFVSERVREAGGAVDP